MLDSLKKGTDVATTSRFLHDASFAGISVRVTMIHGAPGEEARDVMESAEFLEQHRAQIDRVSLNRFQIMIGPSFLERFTQNPERFPTIRRVVRHPRLALADHEQVSSEGVSHWRATQRLLRAVHEINRKPLGPGAQSFDGVM